jgi:exodeoxyribonuclease III
MVKSPAGMVEVHVLHAPAGSVHGWTKIETFEGVSRMLGRTRSRFRILCGDFNTPQEETTEGEIITWAQRRTAGGAWVLNARGEVWDAGERNLFTGPHGLVDAFRAVNGYGASEFSWFTTQNRVGRRFDHVLASEALTPIEAEYVHEGRLQGLSDHSMLAVVLRPNPTEIEQAA